MEVWTRQLRTPRWSSPNCVDAHPPRAPHQRQASRLVHIPGHDLSKLPLPEIAAIVCEGVQTALRQKNHRRPWQRLTQLHPAVAGSHLRPPHHEQQPKLPVARQRQLLQKAQAMAEEMLKATRPTELNTTRRQAHANQERPAPLGRASACCQKSPFAQRLKPSLVVWVHRGTGRAAFHASASWTQAPQRYRNSGPVQMANYTALDSETGVQV